MVWINGKLRRGTLDLLSRLFEQAHILHNNSSRSPYTQERWRTAYNRAFSTSSTGGGPGASTCSRTHASIVSTKRSTSSIVLPACRHTLTRRVGTVGGTTARTTNPAFWQCAASERGCSDNSAKMGDSGHDGDTYNESFIVEDEA